MLSALFRSMILHGFVPDDFGCGLIVPSLIDKTCNVSSLNNYRGITLIQTISKVFELTLLEICEQYLITDDLQFGFKKGLGCADAIFSLRATNEYFRERDSSVYVATLDISKAFDSINHYKLYSTLIKSGLPRWVIAVLINWYSKLHVAVRWKSTDFIAVCSCQLYQTRLIAFACFIHSLY